MNNTFPLEERSIYQIYIENKETTVYKIPVYQRNYAWEEDEITALIKDVYDSLRKDDNAPYYIGTLVTYKRGDNEFEVIDGQQRLTTIYLILKALDIENIHSRLTYSARKISADTIDRLPRFGDESDWGIRNGFSYAKKAISYIVGEKETDSFTSFFLHNVHLIHYSVPKDVDLNHYFEVMNSRGEQLEKHEIVKSLLSQYLKDKNDLATFSYIWEACSNMNVYVQQAFEDCTVFGNNLDNFCIECFEDVPRQDALKGKDTIMNLIGCSVERSSADTESAQNDRFQPIIDFPNFLLIVLKLTRFNDYDDFKPSTFTLDDKELLNEFRKAMKDIDDKEEFVRIFAYNLLKAKYFLDNYVVHHVMSDKEVDGDNPWQLQYYYRQSSKKKYPVNLSDNTDTQKELVHLLSMFEVSFTPKQRKNYLFYCLAHLFHDMDTDSYLEFMQNLADKYFFDVYLNIDCLNDSNQPKPNAFDRRIIDGYDINLDFEWENTDYKRIFEDIYENGRSDIPLFVFNYTDYRLWKKYAGDLRGGKLKKGSSIRNRFFEELGCSDFDLDVFNNFYFSRTRKSLEHYYPQSKAVNDGEESETALSTSQINCFGNFAMIGAEANSSGSDWDPKNKLDHYNDRKTDVISVASLKFKIMMQICNDNHKAMLNDELDRPRYMEWNWEDIQFHQEKMLSIILSV